MTVKNELVFRGSGYAIPLEGIAYLRIYGPGEHRDHSINTVEVYLKSFTEKHKAISIWGEPAIELERAWMEYKNTI